jgi:hypothetical protein
MKLTTERGRLDGLSILTKISRQQEVVNMELNRNIMDITFTTWILKRIGLPPNISMTFPYVDSPCLISRHATSPNTYQMNCAAESGTSRTPHI